MFCSRSQIVAAPFCNLLSKKSKKSNSSGTKTWNNLIVAAANCCARTVGSSLTHQFSIFWDNFQFWLNFSLCPSPNRGDPHLARNNTKSLKYGYEIVRQSCTIYNTTTIMHHSLSCWKLWICSTIKKNFTHHCLQDYSKMLHYHNY